MYPKIYDTPTKKLQSELKRLLKKLPDTCKMDVFCSTAEKKTRHRVSEIKWELNRRK